MSNERVNFSIYSSFIIFYHLISHESIVFHLIIIFFYLLSNFIEKLFTDSVFNRFHWHAIGRKSVIVLIPFHLQWVKWTIRKFLLLNQSPLSSVTRPYSFPATGNGRSRVPAPTWCKVEVIGAHIIGPMRRGMALWTTNEIGRILILILVVHCVHVTQNFFKIEEMRWSWSLNKICM